jgi:hypothetical protein
MRLFLLTLLGIVLLFPSLCGGGFLGAMALDYYQRSSPIVRDYDSLVWVIGAVSLNFGCLGFVLLGRTWGKKWLHVLTKLVAVIALLATVGVIALLAMQTSALASRLEETLMLCGVVAVAFVVGTLPALLVKRKVPAE